MEMGEKMKILQVYPYFCPAWSYGGVTRVAYEISRRLIDRGHEITVYTTDALDNKSRVTIKSNPTYIEGMEIYYFRNLSNYLTYKYHLPLPIGMASIIKEEIKKFDVIHLHGLWHSLNVLLHYYAKKYDIPYILHVHGYTPSTFTFQKKKSMEIFNLFFGYKIIRDASKIIAISNAEAERYKQIDINKNKIVIVPNGIDVDAYKNLPTYGNFREKYGVKENHMILFLGRIHKMKGVDFLIKSFFELTKEIKDVVLVIIGPDDGYKIEVEKLIKTLNLSNKIKVLRYIYGSDKLSAYTDADVLVYPGIFEMFGLVPFEAVMCGTPVVVADDCGCGELVRKANCGYLVKHGDINDLKEKMKMVIENPENGKEMVERGKKYIEENLTWDKVIKEVEEVYLRL
jgi:glycosyltransferase involved in cell wall biosynthesis